METFCPAKSFVHHPEYEVLRTKALNDLDLQSIDQPIIDIVESLACLPYCFTLQSCCGHFIHPGQSDTRYTGSPIDCPPDAQIEYRIAYLALCLQNIPPGHTLYEDLESLTRIDPQYIQFGSANWFWQQSVNTYAVQVEPERYKNQDTAMVSLDEALHLESVRNVMFEEIRKLLLRHPVRIQGTV
jgi:hypothetical protein